MLSQDNLIGDVGARSFARALLKAKSQKGFNLTLTNNNVGDPGALSFASALEKNSELRDFEINLTRNYDELKGKATGKGRGPIPPAPVLITNDDGTIVAFRRAGPPKPPHL